MTTDNQVKKNILQAIGKTPIVGLNRIRPNFPAHLFVKCEFLNPGGSIKDRIAVKIIEWAIQTGQLKPGGTIVEATSGNTGVGIAIASAVLGYRCVLTMADKQSEEKRQFLRSLGAELYICPTDVPAEDPRSYYQVAKRLSKEISGAFYVNQYDNPDNPKAHYEWTGPEIWEQLGESLDVLVAPAGTGGTLVGIGKYLKERKQSIQIIGVDPVGSIYYDLFHHQRYVPPHVYRLEGMGEDYLPKAMDLAVLDDMIQVTDEDSFLMGRRLLKEEGLLAGGSSGACVLGAIQYIEKIKPTKPINILCILPDSASRYLSKYLDDAWMKNQFKKELR